MDKEGKLTLDMREEHPEAKEGEEPKQEEEGIEDKFKKLQLVISGMND